MDFLHQFDIKKHKPSRIELHLHFEGAVQLQTAWELMKKKDLKHDFNTYDSFVRAVRMTSPGSLSEFLDRFKYFMPAIRGDPEALERVAYELCETESEDGVVYFEVRYCPHLSATRHCPPEEVVKAINKGLKRGEMDYKVKARSILCCIYGMSEISQDILKLCEMFKNDGVIGIDIAGDESKGVTISPEDVKVFQRAAQLGIHRTVHAGESGTYKTIYRALEELQTERIGHGYRIFDEPSEETYKIARSRNIHFETCLHSSVLTGACPLSKRKHSIVRFAEDSVNFSINKDDPTITGTTLDDEYKDLQRLGLRELHVIRANFNAARSCFLPEQEKQELEKYLKSIYGVL